MRLYSRSIIEATKCTEAESEEVEDIMRNDVFHSTLDWQPRNLFKSGAREAFVLLRESQKLNN